MVEEALTFTGPRERRGWKSNEMSAEDEMPPSVDVSCVQTMRKKMSKVMVEVFKKTEDQWYEKHQRNNNNKHR